MKPLVVWALQAPTLLNLLARSAAWRLTVADLGDASMLKEAELLRAERYRSGDPAVVFVCTPDHLAAARQRFPRSRHVWVLHNGRRQLLPPTADVAETLCLSHHVARLQQRDGITGHVVVPAYEPSLGFRWTPNKLFVMMSRPSSRTGEREHLLNMVERASGKRATRYGQDQAGGFLYDRAAVYADCSGYLSALPDWAGFGLAEHEALAAGVPVIGNRRWGDMEEELPDYSGLQGSVSEQGRAAKRVAEDAEFAAQLSERGIEFISAHRTRARMDAGITSLLETPP